MRINLLPVACYFSVIVTACTFFSCAGSQKPGLPEHFDYKQFRDSMLRKENTGPADTGNLFDNALFIPGRDSLNTLLQHFDTLWKEETHLIAQMDTVRTKMTTTAGYTEEEKAIIKANIREVDSFLLAKDSTTSLRCHGNDCILFVEIDKGKQLLYLNILGVRKDTFKVSTGKGKKYETPAMELNPEGPVLTRYTSRKFPGGNYQGLGNMPYAVFLKNGYAIHGTTPGNFSKLGTPASHGCIRLHPDHAKIFNALVRTIGIRQTWVSVRDSL